MFRMTLNGSALPLFNAHFVIDEANWSQVDVLFTQRYDLPTKQEEVSDELSSLNIEDFTKEEGADREALMQVIDQMETLYPLSIPSNRNDTMLKGFLRQAISGTEWALQAENGTQMNGTYHADVDTLFSTIRTIQPHKNNIDTSSQHQRILFLSQKKLGRHPLELSSSQLSQITSAFDDKYKNRQLQNRCFNCWIQVFSFESAKSPKNHNHIRRNLEQWKKVRRMKNFYFSVLASLDIDEHKANEVFLASIISSNCVDYSSIHHHEPLQAKEDTNKEIHFKVSFADDQNAASDAEEILCAKASGDVPSIITDDKVTTEISSIELRNSLDINTGHMKNFTAPN